MVKLTEPGATHLASSARLSLEKLVVDEFTLVPLSVTKQLASNWILASCQPHRVTVFKTKYSNETAQLL